VNSLAIKKVLITGGAGYVGAVLVPKLLKHGFEVRVLDLFIYGDNVFGDGSDHHGLELFKGDIRNQALLKKVLSGCDAVIHLACISNDPSFELDPELGKSINYDAFAPLVDIARDSGVKRFIYASSSSVYGIKDEKNVTEDLPLLPLTDYSKYKALCEEVLMTKRMPGFVTLILRPSTVCGYSPRMRLDLTVNILTNHAVNNRKITVFGGKQMRPNIHIEDMTDAYIKSLEWSDDAIDGKIYNVGFDNFTVSEIAEKIRTIVGEDIEIVTTPSNDNRSYHVSSKKIKKELGFTAECTVEDAIRDLVAAFQAGKIPDSMTAARYYNIKTMQEINLR
jgi:nucleoside-diphosphate-sugar epimerase